MLDADLLDFKNPPLVEVVVGVQFEPSHQYHPFHARDVWGLFNNRFPLVQEHPALAPQFETFGVQAQNVINFNLSNPSQQIRYWFLSDDESELIQYQNDRILHNWRKTRGNLTSYPRFESIYNSFMSELYTLQSYRMNKLIISQCEISYINLIDGESQDNIMKNFIKFDVSSGISPTDITLSLRKVIVRDGIPVSRLYVDCGTAVSEGGRPAVALQFTVRGAPRASGIEAALEFIREGRNVIADAFLTVTTDSAQAYWGRVE